MSLLRPATLAFALTFAAIAAPAMAQEAAPVGGEESAGSPVPGYVATAALACAAVFVLCKSARR